MATARRSGSGENGAGGHYPTRQPSRWKRNLAVLVIVAVAIWLAWTWRTWREEALVGAAYGAQAGCVCRYVSQRPMAACEGDLAVLNLHGAGSWTRLTDDAASHAVRASVPLLAQQSASFDPRRGCQLEPWQD